jgi:hypothetical protein
MIKNSMFGNMIQRYGGKISLLVLVFLLCACSGEDQPPLSASQPVPTTTRASAIIATPASSRTPLPASTSTNADSTPRPPARTLTPNISLERAELVEALRGGGYVLYIHAAESDTDIQNLENCSLQSHLSDQGQTDARTIGSSFLALGVPVGQVLHSGSCSSLDIAMLAFGQGEYWVDLSKVPAPLRGERISALRQILSTPPQPGTNNVFIGHGLDIYDVTGITFAEGEAAVYKPLGNPGYSFVARVLPKAWVELERNTANLVQSEPYVSDSIPLEKIAPTQDRNALSPSSAGGRNQIVPPNQSLTAERNLLLPDLTTLSPSDLRIRVNPADGHKLLRFTNSIMNIGPGKMELWGDTNPGSGKMAVTQYLYDTEGAAEKKDVGEFFFHPEHDHWHLGDFARYEIWSVGLDGRLDSVVAVSNKISYCLRDDERSDIPGAARYQTYISCNHERQGISVGWIDIYRYHLPGQSIDITFLFDGIYALRSTVNPENRLWEENRENNTAILYIEIEGNRVRIVEAREILNKPLDGQN